MSSARFSIVDYVIFGCTLLLSSVIGIYHAIKHRRNTSTQEYVLASKTIPWFPLFISMTASFFSAVGVMGYPARVYATGLAFSLTLFNFLVPIVLCAEVIGPLFRKLKLVSVNEYLELRFSRGVRYMGCFFFHLQYLLYLSIVLFAPSLALNSVAGVPLTVTIISTGFICTVYTSLGGMRAVIWTDVFQSFVMMSGLIITTVVAILRVGSVKEVISIAYKSDRLNIDFSPDPKVYHSFWGLVIGLMFTLLGTWCIGQPTIQRVLAAKSDKDAKKALYASFVAICIIVILLSMVGLVIFAFYSDCDLLCSKRIRQNDQILPYFIVNELGHLKGVPGVLTACIYSFALSTISSGLNGMSALFLEDVVKKIKPDLSDIWALRASKIIACTGGLFITGFAFVVPKLGKYVLTLTMKLFGIVGGPYFSIFALGIFTENTNSLGAYVGALVGFGIGATLTIGQLFYPPDLDLPPVSIRGCNALNISVTKSMCPSKSPAGSSAIVMIFSVSYCWHGLIAVLLACVFGYVTSLCSPNKEGTHQVKKELLYNYNGNWFAKKCYKNHEKYEISEKDEITDKDKPLALTSVGKSDPNRTKKWCRRYKIPTKIDEQPGEDESNVLISTDNNV